MYGTGTEWGDDSPVARPSCPCLVYSTDTEWGGDSPVARPSCPCQMYSTGTILSLSGVQHIYRMG